MNQIVKHFSAIALSLGVTTSFAAALKPPTYLITHNQTSEESNAYIAGAPSPYPTKANRDGKVYWNFVKLACSGHTTGNLCSAVIKMATDTANPVEVGTVSMNLETGEISPKQMSANGYTMTVNGPGEASIHKD